MNVSTIHENYSRDPHYYCGKSGGEEREETQTYNVKKCRKIGRSAAPWSKESLKRTVEKEGGVAGLLFFATLSSPTGRKYTRRRTVPERTPLRIRCGKVPEKKKKRERWRWGMRACRRNERHTSLVHYFRAPLRNKPSSYSLSFSLSSAPLLKGNFHTRRSNC